MCIIKSEKKYYFFVRIFIELIDNSYSLVRSIDIFLIYLLSQIIKSQLFLIKSY